MKIFLKGFMIWCMIFGTLALFNMYFIYPIYMVSADMQMDVSVVNDDYHSYTIALNQIQDYYVECNDKNLINITPLGNPIILDGVEGLCFS